eukprot:scaffold379_cov383-Pavlova_lutheri.AAC.6
MQRTIYEGYGKRYKWCSQVSFTLSPVMDSSLALHVACVLQSSSVYCSASLRWNVFVKLSVSNLSFTAPTLQVPDYYVVPYTKLKPSCSKGHAAGEAK